MSIWTFILRWASSSRTGEQNQRLLDLSNLKVVCEACLAKKQAIISKPNQDIQQQDEEVNKLIHIDLIGRLWTKSLNGSKYVVVFTDNKSRKS